MSSGGSKGAPPGDGPHLPEAAGAAIDWFHEKLFSPKEPLPPEGEERERWLDELADAVSDLVILHSAAAYALATGRAPLEEDWKGAKCCWPHPEDVSRFYEDFGALAWHAGLEESPLMAPAKEIGKLERELRRAEAARERSADEARKAKEDAARRVAENDRRVERAKAKADENRAEALALRGRVEALERQLAEARAAAAAEPVAAEPAPASPSASENDERVAALEAELRAAYDETEELAGELADQARRHRAHVLQLTAAAGGDDVAEADDAPDPDDLHEALQRRLAALPADAPETVLEAVETAERVTRNLVFAERAHESAAESPYRSPTLVLHDLVKLDLVAGRYVAGGTGRPPGVDATEINLKWADDSPAAQHGQWGRHYRFRHEGREWTLGPHLRVGGNAPGAGNLCRVYLVLHPGDDEHERQVIVGHVGRHLPDATTG